ncbi:hypothetical protein D3C78_406600 [compost metagenome]
MDEVIVTVLRPHGIQPNFRRVGDTYQTSRRHAAELKANGLVSFREPAPPLNKMAQEPLQKNPTATAGEPSSSSPAGQASAPLTASASAAGGKARAKRA